MIKNEMQIKIKSLLEGVSLRSLFQSSKQLSGEYRAREGGKELRELEGKDHLLAYLAVRMPATYAAICKTFFELQARLPHFSPRSLCDVGAGPGTCLWAAEQQFSEIQKISLIERDERFIAVGKQLAEDLSLISKTRWIQEDMKKLSDGSSYDLVVAAYSIGELHEKDQISVVDNLWKMTNQVLILIEPGTPLGFERLRTLRSHLLSQGAKMIAPCPHASTCPMAEGNWCHFYARLERSSLHRKIKEGERGFEDEKFSYLIVSKTEVALPSARILRHPRKGKGHVKVDLCAADGCQERIVTKKDRELYRIARKSEWGDVFNMERESR